mmetsp:Transcript_11098/g.31403  ORF Transcript_11098/g.31403 Transcript_11098/m.31403 type:complete len:214 (+) Transcript_11098:30-671(+)
MLGQVPPDTPPSPNLWPLPCPFMSSCPSTSCLSCPCPLPFPTRFLSLSLLPLRLHLPSRCPYLLSWLWPWPLPLAPLPLPSPHPPSPFLLTHSPSASPCSPLPFILALGLPLALLAPSLALCLCPCSPVAPCFPLLASLPPLPLRFPDGFCASSCLRPSSSSSPFGRHGGRPCSMPMSGGQGAAHRSFVRSVPPFPWLLPLSPVLPMFVSSVT